MTLAAPPKHPLHPSERDFSAGFRWSLILHLAIAIFILGKSLVFPSRHVQFIPSLRVDIVGLPDLLKGEKARLAKANDPNDTLTEALKKAEAEAKAIKAAKPTAKASKTEEIAKPDEMVLKPKAEDARSRQKRLQNALARIKSLSKIAGEESRPGALIKGNMISKGTSLSGEARESAEANYYDSLRDRLQENWALPVWVARQRLSAQVQLFIDGRGQLHHFRFVKLSGSTQFDDAVKRTLTESQPYPAPPRELAQSVLVDGVLVGFPL